MRNYSVTDGAAKRRRGSELQRVSRASVKKEKLISFIIKFGYIYLTGFVSEYGYFIRFLYLNMVFVSEYGYLSDLYLNMVFTSEYGYLSGFYLFLISEVKSYFLSNFLGIINLAGEKDYQIRFPFSVRSPP